jgi:iron complex outermembrane receptor protein
MKIISTALFAFLCHSMASAAELVDLSLEELMDVEVTLVSRGPQRLTETAAAVFMITGDELRRSGLNSIPEALRLVPGMQVGVVDANKWIVTSRGFAGLFSNKLLVLIDG